MKPGVNGWLVEPGDPSALAGAISGALDDRDGSPRSGTPGEIVEDEFSWDAAGRATVSLYKELLA